MHCVSPLLQHCRSRGIRLRMSIVSIESASEQPLVGEVNANFYGYSCHVVSATDPYGRILGFLDCSR
jgi:hypothetical protein